MLIFRSKYDRVDADIVRLLAEVHAQRGTIQRIPVPPKLAERVNRMVVARTVHGTVAIEGSSLSEEEAQEILSSQETASLPGREREVREALAAQKAHEYIRERWGKDPKLPIRQDDICEIHRILTQDIPYENNTPGRYRHHPVTVGSMRHGGVYRPPEGYDEVRRLMGEFVEWLNTREIVEGEPGPIRAILVHYFFVLIHPFGDGNGRTARALESLILYQGGYNIKGFYSLANYYYRNRDEYFTLLQKTRTDYEGDQGKLLTFALRGLAEELQYIENIVLSRLKIILFTDYVKEMVYTKVLNPRQGAILEYLADRDPEGIPWVQYRTHSLVQGLYRKLTHKTVMRDVRRMAVRGLLKLESSQDKKVTLKARVEVMDSFI